MALFFDSAWFDGRLAARALTRADLARALALTDAEIAELWKDQRELSAREVAAIAALLGASGEEVAAHAGISTPVPELAPAGTEELGRAVASLAERLARVERMLAEVKALLLDLQRGPR
jgi:transcriptional regulator with XRE-family HTH domain